jgi:hypothetical protein
VRALAAVAIAAALAVVAALNFSRFLFAYNQDPHQVAFQDERLQAALAAIPAGATIGYISDVPLEDPSGAVIFDVARYAFAPRPLLMLADAPGAEWVLGCFQRQYDPTAVARQHELSVVADYGNGVAVFRRAK